MDFNKQFKAFAQNLANRSQNGYQVHTYCVVQNIDVDISLKNGEGYTKVAIIINQERDDIDQSLDDAKKIYKTIEIGRWIMEVFVLDTVTGTWYKVSRNGKIHTTDLCKYYNFHLQKHWPHDTCNNQ